MTSEERKAGEYDRRNVVHARNRDMPVDGGLNAAIAGAIDLINELNAGVYDGVRGRPPEWLPKPLEIEFSETRLRLLGSHCAACGTTHSAADVIRWTATYRDAMQPISGYRSVGVWPPAHERDIRDLAYVHDIVVLGEDAGIKAYLGKGQYEVLRGRAIAQRNREYGHRPKTPRKKAPLTRAIERMLSGNRNAAAKTIIRNLPPKLRGTINDRALEQRISRARKNLAKPA